MKRKLTSRQRAYLTVAGAFLVATGGGFGGAFSLFYLPVTAQLGFTQTAFAGYVTIMSMCGVIAQPLVGALLTRFRNRLRLIGVLGGAVGFLCYLGFSRSNSLAQFYVVGAAISLIVPIVNGNLGGSAVTAWFAGRRAAAISVISVGTSVGTVFYTQLVRFVIDRAGWREAYLCMGVSMLLVTALGCLLISESPECYGLLPYGAADTAAEADRPKMKGNGHGISLGTLLRMPCFWLLSLGALFASAYIMGVQQSVTSMFQVDYGFTPALAAGLLSLYSIVCAASKFLMGSIYDRFGITAAIAVVCAGVCSSLLILIFAQGRAAAVIAMVLYGMSNMFGTVILSAYIADVFGPGGFSGAFGWVNIFFTVGVGMGPLLAGMSFDISGSYRGAYALFALFCLCSSALIMLSNRAVRASGGHGGQTEGP